MNCYDVVVVLGSGASRDAGLPTGPQLNDILLAQLRDSVEGFAQLYEVLLRLDPRVSGNYERLFHWLVEVQYTTRLFELLKIDFRRASTAAREASSRIRRIVITALSPPLADCSYLANLGALTPATRLKVFTLNYDLAVERACETAGVALTTGFDARTGRWCPARFRDTAPGISLYKLHSSLNWFEVNDYRRPHDDPDADLQEDSLPPVTIQDAPDWRSQFRNPQRQQSPRLILGPADKVQTDDPYFYLLTAFHHAVSRAKVCVTIGYAWQDPHITDRLDWHRQLNLRIVDVNPRRAPLAFGGITPTAKGLSGFRHYGWLRLNPEDGLTVRSVVNSGALSDVVREVLAGRCHSLLQE